MGIFKLIQTVEYKEYLYIDNECNEIKSKNLSFFSQLLRKYFGMYKETHLQNLFLAAERFSCDDASKKFEIYKRIDDVMKLKVLGEKVETLQRPYLTARNEYFFNILKQEVGEDHDISKSETVSLIAKNLQDFTGDYSYHSLLYNYYNRQVLNEITNSLDRDILIEEAFRSRSLSPLNYKYNTKSEHSWGSIADWSGEELGVICARLLEKNYSRHSREPLSDSELVFARNLMKHCSDFSILGNLRAELLNDHELMVDVCRRGWEDEDVQANFPEELKNDRSFFQAFFEKMRPFSRTFKSITPHSYLRMCSEELKADPKLAFCYLDVFCRPREYDRNGHQIGTFDKNKVKQSLELFSEDLKSNPQFIIKLYKDCLRTEAFDWMDSILRGDPDFHLMAAANGINTLNLLGENLKYDKNLLCRLINETPDMDNVLSLNSICLAFDDSLIFDSDFFITVIKKDNPLLSFNVQFLLGDKAEEILAQAVEKEPAIVKNLCQLSCNDHFYSRLVGLNPELVGPYILRHSKALIERVCNSGPNYDSGSVTIFETILQANPQAYQEIPEDQARHIPVQLLQQLVDNNPPLYRYLLPEQQDVISIPQPRVKNSRENNMN